MRSCGASYSGLKERWDASLERLNVAVGSSWVSCCSLTHHTTACEGLCHVPYAVPVMSWPDHGLETRRRVACALGRARVVLAAHLAAVQLVAPVHTYLAPR